MFVRHTLEHEQQKNHTLTQAEELLWRHRRSGRFQAERSAYTIFRRVYGRAEYEIPDSVHGVPVEGKGNRSVEFG